MRCLLALLALCQTIADPPDPHRLIETFEVNLDLAPEDRWTEVVTKKAENIRLLLKAVTPMLLPHPTSIELIAAVNKSLPSEYLRELQGIATTLKVDLEIVIMANIFYEITGVVNGTMDLSRSCTSLVAQRSNGTVYIARNQDYPPPFTLIMIHVVFLRGGKMVYQGTTYAGTIGLSTAAIFAPDAGWALSIDARDYQGKGTPAGEQAAVAAAAKGAGIFPLMTRQACELGSDYPTAVAFLSNTEMVMTGYFIIAGTKPGQGAIITRNATSELTDVLTLFDNKTRDAGGGVWYVAQTNTDHWKPEPDYPLTNVTRRGIATKVLDSIGPDQIDLLGLWNVLDTYPVYNLGTIHTDLIGPAWGEYRTYKRNGPLVK